MIHMSRELFREVSTFTLIYRPGKIKLDVEVNLPRPRKDKIRYTSHFGKLARKLRGAIE